MSLSTSLFKLIPPTLRRNYCPKPQTWQQIANDIIGGTRVTFLIEQGNYLYNYGPNTPAPENRLFPWLNTTFGRWYIFSGGYWIAPHPLGPGPSGLRVIWVGPNDGTAGGLWRLDEGDGIDPASGTGPTAIAGSFWEVDADFTGRTALGAGAVPVTSNPAVTVSVGDQGGEGQHVLVKDELPKFEENTVKLKAGQVDNLDGDNSQVIVNPAEAPAGLNDYSLPLGNAFGADKPHNNLPPYVGVYFIKRTVRKYYAIAA